MDVTIAAVVFLVTYAVIASDRMNKTIAALLGGLAMIVLNVINQHEAFLAVDFNVIFLLAGMMVLAGILRRTGFFQWVAIRSIKVSQGHPFRILIVLSVITAVLSALLDNVTTVVLIAPVTLSIASILGVSPIPFLVSEILASNIGGTATLIGDPPNILIGSASGLDFVAFLTNMGPVALIVFVVFLLTLRFVFGGVLSVHEDAREAALALDEREVIADAALLRRSLLVIGATLVGFLLHGQLGYEPATIALLGATILMLISRIDPEAVYREVEWPTLFFFVGLFILVEGIVHVGIIDELAARVFDLTAGNQAVTTLGLLWLSGIASGIVDNIPYTATMIPVVESLGADGLVIEPLWWALALGACFGGNLTIIGASANVVVANMAARAGQKITFRAFLPYGALVTFESLVIATIYMWVRYLA
ncbi:MAG TPA: ArsB/NhaD family transporter [Candidatus Limnocylindrales bacterium]|nr:ArsB/NhaD family transporter [Candidatus Limnocylindrales bacterium]